MSHKVENNELVSEEGVSRNSNRKVIIILDRAQLETVKTKKGEFQLLNCDDHLNLMKKNNKDPQLYRPDILHQVTHLSILLNLSILQLISIFNSFSKGINGCIR